jgi:hypothetical protein
MIQSVSYDEYPLAIYLRVFKEIYPYLKGRIRLPLGEAHRILEEAREKDLQLESSPENLRWVHFYHQSEPYSYEIEKALNLLQIDGLIEISFGIITLTDRGKRQGEKANLVEQ